MKSGTPSGIDWDRLEEGEPPDLSTARLLLECPTDDDRLRSLSRARMGRIVTFSRNVTIPVTRLCRNRCKYCGFRGEKGGYLRWDEVAALVKKAEELGCCEALFISGERPELIHSQAREFLDREGFKSTPDYVTWLCGRVLDETDLLPHTNIGNLYAEELRELKRVNASLGLMLEDASERLCGEDMPHHESPGKTPKARLETIEEAGKQRVPFTTGLLVGIGQSEMEIARSLLTIRDIHERYGHIQEIIIQRFLPKVGTGMESGDPPSTRLMMNVVSVARLVLGSRMNVQIPPNIEREFELMIKSGANDLGGISPLTGDEINPEEPWCSEDEIFKRTSLIGYRAEPRPPVYREFACRHYLEPQILRRARSWFKRFEDDARLGKQ